MRSKKKKVQGLKLKPFISLSLSLSALSRPWRRAGEVIVRELERERSLPLSPALAWRSSDPRAHRAAAERGEEATMLSPTTRRRMSCLSASTRIALRAAAASALPLLLILLRKSRRVAGAS